MSCDKSLNPPKPKIPPNSNMIDKRVTTRAGWAQWRTEKFIALSEKRTSESFIMGPWNWQLSVEMNDAEMISVGLFPEPSEISPPLARFLLNVAAQGKNKCIVHEGVIRSAEDFVFPIDLITFTSLPLFVITVDFWSLQMFSHDAGNYIPVFPCDGNTNYELKNPNRFTRMLKDGILTDITINTMDGPLDAHKAVLAASSSFFEKMFNDEEVSTIQIQDMRCDVFWAFLLYIYGAIESEMFWQHRVQLLAAANKYDIPQLREDCEKNLSSDINLDTVFELLELARCYKLKRLKVECFKYLVRLQRKYDIKNKLTDFCTTADKELVAEIERLFGKGS